MFILAPADDDKDINYNKNNRSQINKYFAKKMEERIAMLKTMSYDEWIEYNKTNKLMTYDGHNFYVSIWEKNADTPLRYISFINKVDENEMYQNVSYDDIQQVINDELKIIKYNVDVKLIKNMYYSDNPVTVIDYYWVNNSATNYENKKVIQKESVTMKYTKGNISGVIGISYAVEDITTYSSYKFYNVMNTTDFVSIVAITFIMALCVCYFVTDNNIFQYLPILYLYILNIYIMYFINRQAERVNSDELDKKFEDMNSSTLSIAFLISVNVFFIDYMSKHKKTEANMFNCNVVLFCFSILLLLGSLYKITSYSNGYQMRTIFIKQQLLYNLVIIINGLITMTYLGYIIDAA